MQYEGQICRPPMERASFMLACAVGCAYNQCTFCTLFKHLDYRELPMEQIEEELKRVAAVGGAPKQVFLGDGNAFGMATGRLLEILSMIRRYFPSCCAVNMDATVTDIQGKNNMELFALKEAGVNMLYLGIESGLDDVLAFVKKDHTLSEAYREIGRLKAAGMKYGAHMMTGIAGAGRGMENAQAIAAFFNRTQPEHIINFSLFLHKEAPLYQDILSGRFLPADEMENLREGEKIVSLLDYGCRYDGLHDFVQGRVRGSLPNDREKMLGQYRELIRRFEGEKPRFAYIG